MCRKGQAIQPDDCWSADFVSDKLADGRSIRVLTVVDQFTRECICLEVDRAMNGPKVVAALTQAMAERGARPCSLTLDNGSEFAGRAMKVQKKSLDGIVAKKTTRSLTNKL